MRRWRADGVALLTSALAAGCCAALDASRVAEPMQAARGPEDAPAQVLIERHLPLASACRERCPDRAQEQAELAKIPLCDRKETPKGWATSDEPPYVFEGTCGRWSYVERHDDDRVTRDWFDGDRLLGERQTDASGSVVVTLGDVPQCEPAVPLLVRCTAPLARESWRAEVDLPDACRTLGRCRSGPIR